MKKNKPFHITTHKGRRALKTRLRGVEIINTPVLNKGTGFTKEERKLLGLKGLVPYKTFKIEEQLVRVFNHFTSKKTNLDKYTYLQGLMDRNETLYYRLVLDNLELMLPIVYTPTVGQACKEFERIFRRTRGIYITPEDINMIDTIIKNWPYSNIKVSVITDGERILGLGDLGSNGMGISVGKLALYTVAGGISPTASIPICLDVGTNNKELLKNKLYLGRRKKRISAKLLDKIVGKTLEALNKRFPGILVQFEDFALHNSFRILDKFRGEYCCFNDDIQGTGAVALSGIITATKITGKEFRNIKVVIAGAGSAGIGIATQIANYFQSCGVPEDSINECLYIVDSNGLLDNRRKSLLKFQQKFARNTSGWKKKDLYSVIKKVKPDVLIGTTGVAGLFSNRIIGSMANGAERPLIMPLSNPTDHSEAIPSDIIKLTRGKALIATGSPFPPVKFKGKTYRISQCNNVYIFPGLGLGIISSNAKRVTDNMVMAASKTLSSTLDSDDIRIGRLYPELKSIRKVSRKIAVSVARQALKDSVCRFKPENIHKMIKLNTWEPNYLPYLPE